MSEVAMCCALCKATVGTPHVTGCPRSVGGHRPVVASDAPSADRAMPTQVHLAGPDIAMNGLRRQRCVWCGLLLDEMDLSRIAVQVEPGCEPEPPATLKPGAFYRVLGVNPRAIALIDEDELERGDDGRPMPPSDSCLMIDPWATQ